MKLDKVIAIVTGAASGLGRATAFRIARQGGRVIVADLNPEVKKRWRYVVNVILFGIPMVFSL